MMHTLYTYEYLDRQGDNGVESQFDVWASNYNHVSLLQAGSQSTQDSPNLDGNYPSSYTYTALGVDNGYYEDNLNNINENGFIHSALISTPPISDGIVENSQTTFYSNAEPINYFHPANVSNEVICEQSSSSAFVDPSITDMNNGVWNGCSNGIGEYGESLVMNDAYQVDNYAVSDSADSYCSSLSNNQPSTDGVLHNHTYHQVDPHGRNYLVKRECKSVMSDISDEDGCTSRDEKRAKALDIPISTMDIINLPIDEFNERLAKYELTEVQLSLIRDIRRRGKNKVAAQNCRRRKMDQILDLQTEVEKLYLQKKAFQIQQEQLITLRQIARQKYDKLYDFIRSSAAIKPLST